MCPESTRNVVLEAAIEFLARWRITHYFTLTYPGRVSWERRHQAFHKWLDAIEWLQGRPLGWFRADERRISGLGYPEIPWHHHGLLVATDHLSCSTAESLWRAFGDARVRKYEQNGGAIRYCLKLALTDYGDWDIGGKALRKQQGL